QFTVAAVFLGPHDRNAPNDFPARVVFVEQESRQALARVVGGFGDEYEVRGHASAGNVMLGAVDHPVVAVAHSGGEHHGRVGTCAGRGFRHGKGRADVAAHNGHEPTLALFGRGHLAQHPHVAVV